MRGHRECAAKQRDEELRALADKGGVFGVYLMPFLTPGRQPMLR